jgi:hypothetical protein
MTVEARKLWLINKILNIKDEEYLDGLEHFLAGKLQIDSSSEHLQGLFVPMKAHFDLDELIKEQGYKPITREEFDQLAEEIDLQEPIEELLAQLTK